MAETAFSVTSYKHCFRSAPTFVVWYHCDAITPYFDVLSGRKLWECLDGCVRQYWPQNLFEGASRANWKLVLFCLYLSGRSSTETPTAKLYRKDINRSLRAKIRMKACCDHRCRKDFFQEGPLVDFAMVKFVFFHSETKKSTFLL